MPVGEFASSSAIFCCWRRWPRFGLRGLALWRCTGAGRCCSDLQWDVVDVGAGARCRDGPFGHLDRAWRPRNNGHKGSCDQGRRCNEPQPRGTIAGMDAAVGCRLGNVRRTILTSIRAFELTKHARDARRYGSMTLKHCALRFGVARMRLSANRSSGRIWQTQAWFLPCCGTQ
jgi:hypothetical protein